MNGSTAQTYKSGPHTFVGKNGIIDTGFRSYEFSNSSAGVTNVAYYNEIVNVTSGNGLLDISEYNITWSFFQTNAFQNMSSSNKSGIKIEIDQDGYRANKTSVVWRLQINSNLTETIEVVLKVTIGLSAFVIISAEPIIGDDISFKDFLISLIPGLMVMIGIGLLIIQRWKYGKSRKN